MRYTLHRRLTNARGEPITRPVLRSRTEGEFQAGGYPLHTRRGPRPAHVDRMIHSL